MRRRLAPIHCRPQLNLTAAMVVVFFFVLAIVTYIVHGILLAGFVARQFF